MNKAVDKKKKWTEEEEKILFDTVLDFLKDGKTQKEAFSEAAHSIGRTPGACSFRWNNKLKKNLNMEEENTASTPATIGDCVSFLQSLSSEEELNNENKNLKGKKAELEKNLQVAEETFLNLKANYIELLKHLDSKDMLTSIQFST